MITEQEKQFLQAVLDFAELKDGRTGLLKMATREGQIEYMKKYLAANEETWEKYLLAPDEARHAIMNSLMQTVYNKIKERPEK